MKVTTAIILAGGQGTRLRPVVADLPKAMAPVAGRPFLEYLLRYLIRSGIEEVVLSVGYRAEVIVEHFGDAYRDLRLRYALEEEPLGTGGGVLYAFRATTADQAFVLNGDTFFDVGLDPMVEALDGADAVLALRRLERPDRFGTVELAADGRITAFHEKREGLEQGLVNGGVYLLREAPLADAASGARFSLERDYFEAQAGERVFRGHLADGYMIDIGIPEDYRRAQEEFRAFPH